MRVLQSAKNRPSPIDGYFGARLLHRADLHRLPRHAGGDASTTACCASEIERARARGQGADHAGGRDGRGEIPPGGGRPAQLDQLPRLLEDVLRRGRGGGRLHLRQGRRRLRLRLPPRSRPPARVARRVLPGLLHQPQPPAAHRHDLQVHRRVPGRRPADQLDQELQQLLRRAAPDPARGREAHRQARPPSSSPTWSIRATSRRPTSRTGWRATSR